MMILNKASLSATLLTSVISLSAIAGPNQQDITLTGAISAVSCEVVLNGGSSTLNVGTFAADAFTVASKQVGTTPLYISLNGCSAASEEDSGNLYVQGMTANGSQSLFVNNASNSVGFMLTDAASKPVVNNQAIPLDVTAGSNSYQFTAGMGSLNTTPANGVYSAPIVIAYVSD
ncbi:fimbrial protein [Klebsiella sp. BIGb0407]|uniref:fimbrial protein n=1 Tax=Klebsiella sp. BIGb0407 TaxID=2940603 RepID=UPI00216886B5|nr:fimbrial protein [Klebsiella sp. BIGb0407]MCS3429515.1 type 1 fimbria pilin [Klebsiella sp. BIGb0407]